MTVPDWVILILAVVGLLVCVAGYASTFIPPEYLRKRKHKPESEVTKP